MKTKKEIYEFFHENVLEAMNNFIGNDNHAKQLKEVLDYFYINKPSIKTMYGAYISEGNLYSNTDEHTSETFICEVTKHEQQFRVAIITALTEYICTVATLLDENIMNSIVSEELRYYLED